MKMWKVLIDHKKKKTTVYTTITDVEKQMDDKTTNVLKFIERDGNKIVIEKYKVSYVINLNKNK